MYYIDGRAEFYAETLTGDVCNLGISNANHLIISH
jgi:hypothetical protein